MDDDRWELAGKIPYVRDKNIMEVDAIGQHKRRYLGKVFAFVRLKVRNCLKQALFSHLLPYFSLILSG